MKRLSSRALSAGAILVLLSVTPAFAQVAGNPGDLHTQTLYMKQYKALRGYTAKATDPNKAAEATGTNCGVFHDFNTSQSHFGYIALCPLFLLPLIGDLSAALAGRRQLQKQHEAYSIRSRASYVRALPRQEQQSQLPR